MQPERLGRYLLVGLEGEGAAGEVFRAERHDAAAGDSEASSRAPAATPQVLVERLRVGLLDDAARARFRHRARAFCELVHVGLVRALDAGAAEGRDYLVRELVDGVDLASLLDAAARSGERVPPRVAAFIAAELARALAFLHERAATDGRPLGLVHGDVTPWNVVIGRFGEVKLGGAAMPWTRHDGRARPYRAPEQLAGELLDGRADLYALGAVLGELLAGGDEGSAGARPSSPVGADGPAGLGRVVARLLAPARDARYPTAAAVGRDLRAWLAESGAGDERARLAELVARVVPAADASGSDDDDPDQSDLDATGSYHRPLDGAAEATTAASSPAALAPSSTHARRPPDDRAARTSSSAALRAGSDAAEAPGSPRPRDAAVDDRHAAAVDDRHAAAVDDQHAAAAGVRRVAPPTRLDLDEPGRPRRRIAAAWIVALSCLFVAASLVAARGRGTRRAPADAAATAHRAPASVDPAPPAATDRARTSAAPGADARPVAASLDAAVVDGVRYAVIAVRREVAPHTVVVELRVTTVGAAPRPVDLHGARLRGAPDARPPTVAASRVTSAVPGRHGWQLLEAPPAAAVPAAGAPTVEPDLPPPALGRFRVVRLIFPDVSGDRAAARVLALRPGVELAAPPEVSR